MRTPKSKHRLHKSKAGKPGTLNLIGVDDLFIKAPLALNYGSFCFSEGVLGTRQNEQKRFLWQLELFYFSTILNSIEH